MEGAVVHPPRTIMEVFKMLPEGTLAEVIDNTLYMSPAPIGRHQRVLLKLAHQMLSFAEAANIGEVFISPFDVYLDETSNAVQPDILFIRKENLHIYSDDGHVHGVPDLIIEILSPGNSDHDTIKKKHLYEKFRVKEYWIIDPKSKHTTGYALYERSYRVIFEGEGKIQSNLLKNEFSF